MGKVWKMEKKKSAGEKRGEGKGRSKEERRKRIGEKKTRERSKQWRK